MSDPIRIRAEDQDDRPAWLAQFLDGDQRSLPWREQWIHCVRRLQAVSGAGRAVGCLLASYARTDGKRAWPSLDTLRRDLGKSRNSVRNALADLVALGWLEERPRQDQLGRPKTTEYVLTMPSHSVSVETGRRRAGSDYLTLNQEPADRAPRSPGRSTAPGWPRHVGGRFWELSTGDRVQGTKADAQVEQQRVEAVTTGTGNGSVQNPPDDGGPVLTGTVTGPRRNGGDGSNENHPDGSNQNRGDGSNENPEGDIEKGTEEGNNEKGATSPAASPHATDPEGAGRRRLRRVRRIDELDPDERSDLEAEARADLAEIGQADPPAPQLTARMQTLLEIHDRERHGGVVA